VLAAEGILQAAILVCSFLDEKPTIG